MSFSFFHFPPLQSWQVLYLLKNNLNCWRIKMLLFPLHSPSCIFSSKMLRIEDQPMCCPQGIIKASLTFAFISLSEKKAWWNALFNFALGNRDMRCGMYSVRLLYTASICEYSLRFICIWRLTGNEIGNCKLGVCNWRYFSLDSPFSEADMEKAKIKVWERSNYDSKQS